jgi:ubiquinone/menaquinone biosynthesis C-methylase UbiE
MTMMANSVTRFDGRAKEYERYRERYDAEEILTQLREWTGLTPESIVADIGAGTGMLADVFLANGNRVLAIEPNAEMRAACERLHESERRLEIRDGTAEATGLEDASVDIISAGRALHWFDPELAMREFRRVLKPGGWVVIVAAGRGESRREENEAFQQVLERFSCDAPYREKAYKAYAGMKDFFEGGEFRQYERGGEMQMNWEQLRGMALSLSHTPRVDDPRFREFERELREFYERDAKNGAVTLETRCWVNAGRFAPNVVSTR